MAGVWRVSPSGRARWKQLERQCLMVNNRIQEIYDTMRREAKSSVAISANM